MKNHHIMLRAAIFSFFTLVVINGFAIDNEIGLNTKPAGISFRENKGQICDQNHEARPDVLFSGRAGRLSYHLLTGGISYQLSQPTKFEDVYCTHSDTYSKRKSEVHIHRVDIQWKNINAFYQIDARHPSHDYDNYYFDHHEPVHNVRSFDEIFYRNIYNGIDLHYYGSGDQLKYDFIVQPGADYTMIGLEISGADELIVLPDGSILMHTSIGDIIEDAPLVFQNEKIIDSRWILEGNNLRFELDEFDASQPLVIDPGLRVWGTYYGGSDEDRAFSIATDNFDHVYIGGMAYSEESEVIATTGSFDVFYTGSANGFFAQFNSDGVRQWGTYLDGTFQDDHVNSLKTDAAGFLYVITVHSGNSLATPGTHQQSSAGSYDAVLMKFNMLGERVWGTYFGGEGSEVARGMELDRQGNIYVAGSTYSEDGNNFATPGAHQGQLGGIVDDQDAFLVKFNQTGQRIWSTYYGGIGSDIGYDCTTDSAGNVYLCGQTIDAVGESIATSGSHQDTPSNMEDAFLVKFNSEGVRQWGTYYGGTNIDRAYSCGADSMGHVFIAGMSISTGSGIIGTVGTYQSYNAGSTDGFCAKFDTTGSRIWGTYMGSNLPDIAQSVAADSMGNVYVGGYIQYGQSIATPGSHQVYGEAVNCYILYLDANGDRIWGSLYGGNEQERGGFISVDNYGNPYMAGSTESTNASFMSTTGAHQTALGSSGPNDTSIEYDAFLVRFCNGPDAPLNTTIDQSGCYGDAFLLSGDGVGELTWYTSSTGGNPIEAGNSFQTANLFANTTFYLQDSTNCASTRTPFFCSVNPDIIIDVTNSNDVTCNGGQDGSIAIAVSGGDFPFSYSWSPNGQTTNSITGLGPGEYECIVTDEDLCQDSVTVVITMPEIISTSVSSQTDVLCYGGADGSVEISADGGEGNYTYTWLPDVGSTALLNGLEAGVYLCTVSDGINCGIEEITIAEPANPLEVILASLNGPTCPGDDDGSLSLEASGGTGDYTFTWTEPATTGAQLNGLSAGIYNCIVTDENNCQQEIEVLVTDPETINTTIDVSGFTLESNQANAAYQWIDCTSEEIIAGAVNQTFTATYNSSFGVIINLDGCIDTSECVFMTPIDINETYSDDDLIVFPNPTTGIFYLQLPSLSEVHITDLTGRIIWIGRLGSTSQINALENAENGVYLVTVTSEGETKTIRIVKSE